jgi:hypothetical protein
MKKAGLLALTASTVLWAGAGHAAKTPEEAFKEGKPYIDVRYRYEFVDQDGPAPVSKDAHASTLRTRLGYQSGELLHLSGLLEFENIAKVGEDNYNDTTNGKTAYPIVADVEGTEVNQAFLQFSGIPDTRVRIGRERINLDNERFVGSVGWRQNDQTFDAVNVLNASLPDTKLFYGYVNNVNRVFGDDSPVGDWSGDVHLLNASNASVPEAVVTAYAYFADLKDVPALSSKTFGASLTGEIPIVKERKVSFKYRAEYARQSDYGNNPANYDADYYHIAPAVAWNGLTVTAAYESLGSDGGAVGFSTPLATLHKFNGWADKFLATPAGGLNDAYAEVSYKVSGAEGRAAFLNGLLLVGQYHDFSADKGGADYGKEYDAYVKLPILTHYYLESKYADYQTEGFATDTRKYIFGAGMTF